MCGLSYSITILFVCSCCGLLVFLVGFCSAFPWPFLSLLLCCVEAEAVFSINQCLGGLYREGVFIKAEKAKQLSNQGLTFLKLYGDLAQMAFDRKLKRFPLVPKVHYLHHQFLDLLHQSQRCQWCMNILIFGVQLQEDFIGKPSRISRRVSAQTTSLRVIQRTFLAVRNALGDAD